MKKGGEPHPSKIDLLHAVEKNRQNAESHLLQTSGNLKNIFHELQACMVELEHENEELRRTSAEHANLHNWYQGLFERAPVGYCIFSQAGIILDANDVACRFLGIDRNQAIGRSFTRFIHPEAREKFVSHLKALGPDLKKDAVEMPIIVDEHTTRIVLIESAIQREHPDMITAVLIDMSKRPSMFDQLHTSEDKFRQLFNEMLGGAAIVDFHWDESGAPIDALILDVNVALERMTGIARQSAVGRRILEIFPATEQYWFEALSDTPRLGKTTRIDAYHRPSRKYLALKAFKLSQGQIVITGIEMAAEKKEPKVSQVRKSDELEIQVEARTAKLEDCIDDLVERIEKIGESEKRLLQTNKLLAARVDQVRRLAADIILSEQRERRRLSQVLHHNLQENLLSVRMRLGIIQDNVPGADPEYEMEKIDALLDESLQVAKSLSEHISPPVLQEEDLGAWLRWLTRWMQQKHGLTVDLRMDHDYRLPQDMLLMVFESVRDLLFNAATHAKVSKATVRVQEIECSQIKISVLDQGIGFDPCRLRSPSDDEGLEILTIRSRINLIGGRFHIDSAPEKGSCFTIVLPDPNAILENPAQPVALENAGRRFDRKPSCRKVLHGSLIIGTNSRLNARRRLLNNGA